MKKNIQHTILAVALLLLSGVSALAQVNFTTLVPKESIIEGESFQVQYIVEGAERITNFKPLSFINFRMVSGPEIYPGQAIDRAKISTTRNTIYTLQAIKPGLFKIPGAIAMVNGKPLKSNDAWVTVISRREANRRQTHNGGQQDNLSYLRPDEDPYQKIRQNLFVKVMVNKNTCFAGEPVVATFKLYSRLQSRSEIYKNPGLYGFAVQDMIGLDDKRVSEELLNGKLFDVHTIRKVQLYPLQPGSFSIDPMEIKNKVEFSRSIVNKKTEQEVVEGVFEDNNAVPDPGKQVFETIIGTAPVAILVKPLPIKNKPENFTGANGNFAIHASLEKNELKRNEEGYLVISIDGKGNFNQLSAPDILWPAGLEGFDPVVSESLDKSTVPLAGTKKFRYAFVAARAGVYELPAIAFSFYNPDNNRYKTVFTNSINISVSTQAKAKAVIPKDKPSINDVNHKTSLVAAAIVGLLVLLVTIYWLTKRKETAIIKSEKSIVTGMTIDEALKPAYLLMPAADKDFYTVLHQSVWQWLAQQFNLSGSEMNKQLLGIKMEATGKSSQLNKEITKILQHCEAGMFTNAVLDENKEELLEKIKRLLTQAKS